MFFLKTTCFFYYEASHRARERSSQCERDCTTECRKCHYDDGFCKEDAAHNKMCYCYDRTPDGFRFEEVPLCSILVGVLRLLDGLLSGLLGGL